MPDSASRIRTYVLRQGRITEAQKTALETQGPHYVLPFSDRTLDFAAVFGPDRPVVMEIGFGMGQATWRIAKERSEFAYLAVEVHSPGVGRLLMDIDRENIDNLRIVQYDAIEVLEHMIAPASLAGLHIFYPDPWQKKRHHKRRIMRDDLIGLMVSRLVPGGYLYFVTDIEDYAQATYELLARTEGLRNPYSGFAPRREWRPETKFESRAKEDMRSAWELWCVRAS
ncbi:MAG: tRNA (guanosine(46)-N7)-methyltransferase TrmB [Rectinemataceae bacterium]